MTARRLLVALGLAGAALLALLRFLAALIADYDQAEVDVHSWW